MPNSMPMRVHTHSGCHLDNAASPAGGTKKRFPQSSTSVGLGGANRPADALEIQTALNRIPVSLGGPWPLLKPDSIVGPKTIGAITDFQTFHFGEKKADGRVDVEQRTI